MKEQEVKTIKRLLENEKFYTQSYSMYRFLLKDECRTHIAPFKYRNAIGLDKAGLLSSLLEAYHQQRLKDVESD